MLSLLNVTKQYTLDEQTVITPVRDVTLSIKRREFVIITGRSGSGKTTLLNLAAGLVRPTSGRVMIDDMSLWDMSDRQLSLLRASKIGFVFQFPSLLPSLTVLENITMPTTFGPDRNHKGACKRAAELLQMVGLSERMKAHPRQLSAGKQKRVVIARSLVNQPEVLLADEPTSDLDTETEHEIMTLLKEIHDGGVTVLMVTHSPELLPYATRALKMDNGILADIAKEKKTAAN